MGQCLSKNQQKTEFSQNQAENKTLKTQNRLQHLFEAKPNNEQVNIKYTASQYIPKPQQKIQYPMNSSTKNYQNKESEKKEKISHLMNSNQKIQKKNQSNKKSIKNQVQTCPICLDNFPDTKTICNHNFCKQCIEKATNIMNYCPMCRRFNPLNKLIEKNDQTQQIPSHQDWNIQRARGVVYKIEKLENGQTQRRLYLKDETGRQEATNVFVSPEAKIHCSPNANIMINGKRVNPNECNQQ